jgi:dynein heavy chain 1
VHVHNTVRRVNEMESRKGHRVTAVTPRHFLDFIQHYTNIFHEKRRDLEEEKLHLNIGLNKIGETEEQVKELQKSLQQKGTELKEKQSAANAKLKEMLADQQQAEKEKELSEQLQKELAQQLEQITARNAKVTEELDQVMPAVEDARQAVKGIKKAQLVELRSMTSPPPAVKLAMESVCLLLGENVGTDWKAIRGVMVKDDFIQRILNFNTENVSPATIQAMDKYAQNSDWDYEKINRASTACGPMVKWVKSQLTYSTVLNQVEPLQNELKRLRNDAQTKERKGEELKETIAELEQRIATYKDEYAQLIGQAETIKIDLATVQRKVERSVQLLSSLRSERDRWQGGCEGFSQQMETLVGDALLSAAFLAYAGYYDQQLRDVLFHRWIAHLQTAEVRFRSDLDDNNNIN